MRTVRIWRDIASGGASLIVSLILAMTVSGCSKSADETARLALRDADRAARLKPAEELGSVLASSVIRDDESESAYVLRSAYWLKRGVPERCLSNIAKVDPRGPYRAASLWLAGEGLYRQGDLAQSLTILREAAVESPEDLDVHRCLAAIYFDLGSSNECRKELDEVIRLDPSDYRPHHLLGKIDLDFENHARAIGHFRKAIELCQVATVQPALQRGLAAALARERQYDKIVSEFPDDIEDPLVAIRVAEARWGLGQADRAQAILDRVLERSPDVHEACYLLARIADEKGDSGSAVRLLKDLLEKDPHHLQGRYHLALILRRIGDEAGFQEAMRLKDESQELVDRLVKLNQDAIDRPGDFVVRQELAEVCRRLGKNELAGSWERAAAALQKQSAPPSPSAK